MDEIVFPDFDEAPPGSPGTTPPAPEFPGAGVGAVSGPSYVSRTALPARRIAAGYLPDGTPLQWTMDRLTLYREAAFADGAENPGRPERGEDALLLLFLASHERHVWSEPRILPGAAGVLPPLRAASWDFLAAVAAWAAETFYPSEEDSIMQLALHLWDWHHSNEVFPITGSEAQKKRAVPARPLHTAPQSSTSSPEETSNGGTTSGTASPSTMSTPPSMPGTPPTELPSPPEKTP